MRLPLHLQSCLQVVASSSSCTSCCLILILLQGCHLHLSSPARLFSHFEVDSIPFFSFVCIIYILAILPIHFILYLHFCVCISLVPISYSFPTRIRSTLIQCPARHIILSTSASSSPQAVSFHQIHKIHKSALVSFSQLQHFNSSSPNKFQ